jgi:hypothetical protein
MHGGPGPTFTKLEDVHDGNPNIVKLAEDVVWSDVYARAKLYYGEGIPPEPYQKHTYLQGMRGKGTMVYTLRALKEFLEKVGGKILISGHKHENDEPFDDGEFEEEDRKIQIRLATGAYADRSKLTHAYIAIKPDGSIIRHEVREDEDPPKKIEILKKSV